MPAVSELAADVGVRPACEALHVPRASFYRWQRRTGAVAEANPRPRPVRALTTIERENGLARLHEERFQDRSPSAVYATLLDEGEYHCSIRTMYRLPGNRASVATTPPALPHALIAGAGEEQSAIANGPALRLIEKFALRAGH